MGAHPTPRSSTDVCPPHVTPARITAVTVVLEFVIAPAGARSDSCTVLPGRQPARRADR